MTDISPLATSIPSRLGTTSRVEDGRLVFRITPVPTTCVHGALRTSVMSFAVDAATGVAVDSDPERWTFTSDLVVRMPLTDPPEWIDVRPTVLRDGRRSATCSARLVGADGVEVGYGAGGFTRVDRREDDPPKHPFDPDVARNRWDRITPIEEPLPEAMGLRVLDAAAGVVEVDVRPDLRNPAGALQGAMVAALVEAAAEAALGATWGGPAYVTDLHVRYLAQNRTGPIRSAVRVVGHGPDATALVELTDVSTGRLTTHATARAVPVPAERL
ncbi:MAG: hypothetical protein MUE36_14595 [Acidimicrobiales bacterium]|jgi:acyl-coenzyme A thioesterase PaaI-like protein|nr:hypothetical protein [Acidimicrobiales bacterium]